MYVCMYEKHIHINNSTKSTMQTNIINIIFIKIMLIYQYNIYNNNNEYKQPLISL